MKAPNVVYAGAKINSCSPHPADARPEAVRPPGYIFELKHDGFRALAYIDAGECKLISRNLNRFKSFESLKKLLDKFPVQNAKIGQCMVGLLKSRSRC